MRRAAVGTPYRPVNTLRETTDVNAADRSAEDYGSDPRRPPDVHRAGIGDGAGMQKIKDAAADFLSGRRIAVTGVSRTAKGHGSNAVYQRLRSRGYAVFAVNPNASEVEGDRAYAALADIPGGVDGVVIGTRPELAEATMRECVALGITHVWMHRGPGPGSVSAEATAFGREHGITVIDGGCPCMFGPTADAGHRMMRRLLTLSGSVPREVS